jgi:hypothetical protein
MRKLKTLANRQQRMRTRIQSGQSGRGRPPIQFDQVLVQQLASQFLSNNQIAEMLGTTTRTLLRHCQDALETGRAPFMAPVKIALYHKAMAGHWPALRLLLEYHTELKGNPDARKRTQQSQDRAVLRFFESKKTKGQSVSKFER